MRNSNNNCTNYNDKAHYYRSQAFWNITRWFAKALKKFFTRSAVDARKLTEVEPKEARNNSVASAKCGAEFDNQISIEIHDRTPSEIISKAA